MGRVWSVEWGEWDARANEVSELSRMRGEKDSKEKHTINSFT